MLLGVEVEVVSKHQVALEDQVAFPYRQEGEAEGACSCQPSLDQEVAEVGEAFPFHLEEAHPFRPFQVEVEEVIPFHPFQEEGEVEEAVPFHPFQEEEEVGEAIPYRPFPEEGEVVEVNHRLMDYYTYFAPFDHIAALTLAFRVDLQHFFAIPRVRAMHRLKVAIVRPCANHLAPGHRPYSKKQGQHKDALQTLHCQ